LISNVRILLKRKQFLTQVLTLITGTTIAQLIPIAISPLLTRMYSPEDFGIFTLFTTMASLVGIVAAGRYELAIILPKDDEDAVSIFILCIIITSALSLTALGIITLFHSGIASIMKNEGVSKWLFVLPLTILLAGFCQSLNYWFNRKKQFRNMATSRVAQSASTGAANIAFGFLGTGSFGLIVGGIVGQVAAFLYLGRLFAIKDLGKLKFVSKYRMMKKAKEYKDFPTVNALHAFVDMLQLSGITFIISSFFGSTLLGFYALTMRIIQAPISLIGSSIAQVFYQSATRIYQDNGDLYRYLLSMVRRLSMIGIAVSALLYLSPPLFRFFFGEMWTEAGSYAQILAPWVLVKMIISPISQIPIILGKQRTAFCIASIYIGLLLTILFAVSRTYGDIHVTLMALSGFTVVYHVFYGYWIIKIVKTNSVKPQEN
jgi:O-antigen/teichoic acid export membrane protein